MTTPILGITGVEGLPGNSVEGLPGNRTRLRVKASITAVSVAGSFVVGQGSQRVCTGESNCVRRSCCRSRRQRRRAMGRGLPYAPATPLRSGGARAPAPLLRLLSVPVHSTSDDIGFSSTAVLYSQTGYMVTQNDAR